MDYSSPLIALISAILFGYFQLFVFKSLNKKFYKLPLIISIILIPIGVIGYLSTLFSSRIIYFLIMTQSGLIGIIVCTAMLITYKIK